MNKIKYSIVLFLLSIVIYSCGDDNFNGINNPFLDIDHEALALSDNDTLVNFLKNHYYDDTVGVDSVKTLVAGKTPLFDNIITMNVKRNDIDYKLYVYKIKDGNPIDPVYGSPSDDKGYPSVSDSIYANYSGQAILSSTELGVNFDRNTTGAWFSYTSLAVRGWSFGFTNFKGGYLKKEADGSVFNGPITYLDGAKGILFIPSGLSYTSIDTRNYSSSLVNQNLLFYVELLDFVKDTDHDNDGTPSDEEDANNDGDLTNDFSDADNPTFADYLNPNVN